MNLGIGTYRFQHDWSSNIFVGNRVYVLFQLYTSPREVFSGSEVDHDNSYLKTILNKKDSEIMSLKNQLAVSTSVITTFSLHWLHVTLLQIELFICFYSFDIYVCDTVAWFFKNNSILILRHFTAFQNVSRKMKGRCDSVYCGTVGILIICKVFWNHRLQEYLYLLWILKSEQGGLGD